MVVSHRPFSVERSGLRLLWSLVALVEPLVLADRAYSRVGGGCDLHAQRLVENRGMFEHPQLGWISAVRY